MIKIKGDKRSFKVLDSKCIGCKCLVLGDYQVRGATMSGSRNTGQSDSCCLTRAYRGCPNEADRGYSLELVVERKKEGMKISG